MIAAVLEARGDNRRKLYRRVKHLYDVRSRIIHGRDVVKQEINDHVVEVRGLLSQLLCTFVEDENVPSRDDFEQLVFE